MKIKEEEEGVCVCMRLLAAQANYRSHRGIREPQSQHGAESGLSVPFRSQPRVYYHPNVPWLFHRASRESTLAQGPYPRTPYLTVDIQARCGVARPLRVLPVPEAPQGANEMESPWGSGEKLKVGGRAPAAAPLMNIIPGIDLLRGQKATSGLAGLL